MDLAFREHEIVNIVYILVSPIGWHDMRKSKSKYI